MKTAHIPNGPELFKKNKICISSAELLFNKKPFKLLTIIFRILKKTKLREEPSKW